MRQRLRRVLFVMLAGLLLYGAFVLWRDTKKIADVLGTFHWWSFGAACAFAFCNYVLRFFKWEFYLSRLGITGVKKSDSFLTFQKKMISAGRLARAKSQIEK